MNYISAEKGNPLHYKILEDLMVEYVAETDRHQNISTPKNIIPKITQSMLDKLDENRILQIVVNDTEGIGFCYAKIDKEGDRGLIRPNWGYMMEFFIRPPYRRQGIGRKLVDVCEAFFIHNGVEHVWLTADSVTGIPFWRASEYCESDEISVENNQKIMTKKLTNL